MSSADITGTASMDELALALGSKDDKKDDTVKVSAPRHPHVETIQEHGRSLLWNNLRVLTILPMHVPDGSTYTMLSAAS